METLTPLLHLPPYTNSNTMMDIVNNIFVFITISTLFTYTEKQPSAFQPGTAFYFDLVCKSVGLVPGSLNIWDKIHTYRKSKKEPINGRSQDWLNHESQDCLSACLSVRTIVKMIFFFWACLGICEKSCKFIILCSPLFFLL